MLMISLNDNHGDYVMTLNTNFKSCFYLPTGV